MADDYTPDPDIDQNDDPGGLRAFLTRSDVDPDEEQGQQPEQVNAPAPPNVNDASTQPRIAPPTGSSIPVPSYASQAPKYQPPDDSKLQGLIAQRKADAAPVDPSTVSPKWYQRLGGALVAGSMAFGREPGALEAGSAITNQRANAASAGRASKLQEDDAEIQQETSNEDRQAKQYEAQLQGYRAGLEGAGVDERVKQDANAQSNSDRDYNRSTANDKFTQTRETKNDTFDQDYKNRDLTQRGKDAAANTAIARGRLSVEQQRLKDDEADSGPSARNAKLQTAISEKYGDLTDKLENGDPKGATPAKQKGFKQNYREAQQSKLNPDTGDPWQQGEQQQYLQNLKQQNADRKNSYAARQRDELANAGRNVPLVQYDAEGRVIQGQSPAQSAPAAPSAVTQPHMAPQNTGPTPTTAVTTGQPARVKVKAGTVAVGTPVVYNGVKGTVTGINPKSGKPIVQWEK
jgi:hypothetical protein